MVLNKSIRQCINSLRGGYYEQVQHKICGVNDNGCFGYCVVGCILQSYIVSERLDVYLIDHKDAWLSDLIASDGDILPGFLDWLGVTRSDTTKLFYGVYEGREVSLPILNDVYSLTLAECADVWEAYLLKHNIGVVSDKVG